MSGEHKHVHGLVGSTLRTAFLLTLFILVVEVGGGVLSNSLALISDAGHVLTDLIALGLAWFAASQAERPANVRMTYGYHRTGILVALFNAATLIAVVALIAYEAIERLQHPQVVAPTFMFVAAAIGIAINLFIGFSLRGADHHNLNARAAMLHVFGDVGASAAVIVGGLVILATGWDLADPIVSLLIAALIAKGAWDVLGEALGILLEATPRNVDVAQMVRDMTGLPTVKDVHDLHVWSLAGGMPVLTAHVQVTQDCTLSTCEPVIDRLNELLRRKYGIAHTTIQLECVGCVHTALYCRVSAPAHIHEE